MSDSPLKHAAKVSVHLKHIHFDFCMIHRVMSYPASCEALDFFPGFSDLRKIKALARLSSAFSQLARGLP